MVIALVYSALVLSCGYAILRPLGLLKGPLGLALLAPAGIASIAVLSTWLTSFGLRAPLAGLSVLALGLVGVGLVVRDWSSLRLATASFVREHRGSAIALGLALLVPMFAMTVAFWGIQVPLSPHDGAHHTEAADALRFGREWTDWYPPGTSASFASALQLLPWLDTALGTFSLGMAASLLAPLIVFGLSVAVLRNLPMASAGALLVSVTYLYPYFPQVWSGWPLLLSLVMAVGVWIVAVEYVERPSWQWAALGGLLLGATVLVHGSELYTLAIVLVVVAVANWRRLTWSALPRHLGLALVLAVLIALPYVSILLNWAGAGGAYGTGVEDSAALEGGAISFSPSSLFLVMLAQSGGVDLPIRLVLLGAGIWYVLRSRVGRSLVVIGGLFLCVTLTFTFLAGFSSVRWAYAVTFPWGMHYRVLMLVELAQVVLAGAGVVYLGQVLGAWFGRRIPGWSAAVPSPGVRRVRRLGRLLVVTWFLLAVWSITYSLSIPTALVDGFSGNDAAAMAWLRAHAAAGEIVGNDTYADAGIWAPYKAGVSGLLVQRVPQDPTQDADQRLVFANIGQLETSPEATAAACRLHLGYVYWGDRVSGWDVRRFPPLEQLRGSSALEEVFTAGDATVFRVKLPC